MKQLPVASATGSIHSGTIGEVEGRDAGADAERLAQREAVDAPADLVAVLAFEQIGNAAGEFDHLQTARHLAARVGDDLAVLDADQRRELGEVVLDQVAEAEHHARARQRRRARPRRESGLRRLHRGVDVGARAEDDLARVRAGGRIEDGRAPRTVSGGALAADEMRYGLLHADSGRGARSGVRTAAGADG
jgi:hypothetical protein